MAKDIFLNQLQKFNLEHAKNAKNANEIIQKHKQQLQKDILDKLDKPYAFQSKSVLAKEFHELQVEFKNIFKQWDMELDKVIEAQYLSTHFQNRIIFLVYGKVNAGKSSFCNFIASIFDHDQIERFTFQDGKILPIAEPFQEGCTETTAHIQGVKLGSNFLLLDSPGLHSVTPENGQLTQDFIDCTDAVLWLTPSGSPGQVDELFDLKAELSKQKPLLPLITGSDLLEEDDDTGDQYIVNKSGAARAKQETDVFQRLNDYIDQNKETVHSLAKTPLSISLYAYKESNQSDEDFKDAGLDQLFMQMTKLIEEASHYKLIKNQQQAQNFLKNKIVQSIDEVFITRLNQVMRSLISTKDKIDQQQRNAILTVQSKMQLVVDTQIQKHSHNKNKKQLVNELNAQLNQSVNAVLSETLGQLMQHIKQVHHELSSENFKDFKDDEIEIEQVKGKVLSRATGILGGVLSGLAVGATAGTLGAGPIGTALGGIVGGIAGGIGSGALGEQIFVETDKVTEIVGVNSIELDESLNQYLNSQIPIIVKKSFDQVRSEITMCSQNLDQIIKVLNDFKQDIEKNAEGMKYVE